MKPYEEGARMLTVVIPVYNRAELVRRTLECVAAQTLRPLNVILVDNNSTDNTLEVLNKWKREVETCDFHVTLLQETIPGAAAARNRGLRDVTTPYTMFFDSDDLMAPDHCRRAVEGFLSHPDADIVGWDVEGTDSGGKRSLRRFHSKKPHWNNIEFGSMATQRYAATTGLFREVGGWNPDCRGWNDTELGTRLLLVCKKAVKLSGRATVNVIHTSESITGCSFTSGAGKWEEALDFIEKDFRNHYPADSPLLRRYLRYVNLRRAVLAGDYSCENSPRLASRLLEDTLRREPSAVYRMIYRFAYRWRSLGFPGAARLLAPLF